MAKKIFSILLVFTLLIATIPFTQAAANSGDLTDEEIQNLAFSKFLSGILSNFSLSEIDSLIDILNAIDEKNIVMDNLFKNDALKTRLENYYGIDQESVEGALGDLRAKDWKANLSSIAETIKTKTNDTDKKLEQSQIDWIKSVDNEVFDANFPQLTDKILSTFNSKADFIRFNRQIFDNVLTKYISFTYRNSTFTVSFSSSFGTELNKYLQNQSSNVNALFKTGESIDPLSDDEIAGVKQAITDIVSAINTNLTSAQKDELADALDKVGFSVTTIPSGGGGTSSGGGGGGGGTTTTEKPAIKEPSSSTEPIRVNVPSDAVKVSEQDGKSVVTLDENTVNDLLKLLDQAASKAEGKALAITFDLTASKIKDNVSLTLPASLVAKALDKGAAVVVKTGMLSMEIPASAVGAQGEMKINVSALPASDALKGITGLDYMRTIGKAAEISITIADKSAQMKDRLTLRFAIKGLAANIDKLGVYYVNQDAGKLEFVGGKVDKENAEIIAVVPHLSTYVLAEYSKTFSDIRTHWAKNYIESMAAKHVIDGRSEDVFAPEDKVTRAEFAKIIVQTLGFDIKKYAGTFEDVNSTAWYADYVQTAYDNKLIQGKVAGQMFDPNGKITRQEMMTIIGRALSASQPESASSLASYKDAGSVADYAKPYVSYLIGKGLVSGYPDGTIKPQNNTTRAEAVKLIYNIYNQ
ncbi:MAG: S-layer homology domain-containing protein [Tepidanaerobacteraceae bacterium]|nr:S-layer homology domain-containing protein [Tepidanaerobacteraceae bacterium]